MMVKWFIDGDGDWNMFVDGEYEALVCNRFTEDGTYRMWHLGNKHELGTLDPEEAKAAAFAVWAFNK